MSRNANTGRTYTDADLRTVQRARMEGLVEQWRANADMREEDYGDRDESIVTTLRDCADELADALAVWDGGDDEDVPPDADRIWTSENGGFEIWRDNTPKSGPAFSLFHHGEWVGDYWYTQQAKRDAVPVDCSKCNDYERNA